MSYEDISDFVELGEFKTILLYLECDKLLGELDKTFKEIEKELLQQVITQWEELLKDCPPNVRIKYFYYPTLKIVGQNLVLDGFFVFEAKQNERETD